MKSQASGGVNCLPWNSTPARVYISYQGRVILQFQWTQGTALQRGGVGVQGTALPVMGHHSCGGTRDCTDCQGAALLWGFKGLYWLSRGRTLVEKQGTALDVMGQHSCGDSRDCTGCQMTALSCANSRDCIRSQEPALLWKFKGLHWLSGASTPAEIQGTAPTVTGQHSCGSSRASTHVFLWGD